jgi:hypothetical protein
MTIIKKMGYTVYCKNQNVWNPSLAVGNYFLSNLQNLEKLIGIKSGITSLIADSIEIESRELSIFVNNLSDYIEKTNNTQLLAMIAGISEIILALNAKINNDFPEMTERNRGLVERSKKVFYPITDYLAQ